MPRTYRIGRGCQSQPLFVVPPTTQLGTDWITPDESASVGGRQRSQLRLSSGRTSLITTAEFREKNVLAAAADLDEWDDAIAGYRDLHPTN